MGRQLRRFSVRVGLLAGTAACCAFAHHRWGLRRSGATLSAPPLEGLSTLPPRERRRRHRDALDASAGAGEAGGAVFDVLVVGGGLTGLYAAVDAAQRGLRVALVEAGDFGCGSTATQPVLQPGAFPYVQRALRQRDPRWLRRGYDTLVNATVWANTAPHCTQLRVGEEATASVARTLIPAMHSAELAELAVTAVLSTALSVVCGPLRWCGVGFTAGATDREAPGLLSTREGRSGACGSVVACDFLLDGSRAAVSLACTAERLGVAMLNYAPLCALQYADEDSAARSQAGGGPLLVATVRDDAPRTTAGSASSSSPTYVRLRTRGVINCAGAWADEVRALVPGNPLGTAPSVYDRRFIYSYLVAPRSAVTSQAAPASAAAGEEAGASAASQERAWVSMPWLSRPGAALQVSSTQYTFSTMLVTPWHDDTVLLGPSITPLRSHSPSTASASPSAATSSSFLLHSTDGFRAQRTHIMKALRSCGVVVDSTRVLSCLSTIVPVTAGPLVVPWVGDLTAKGHHVHCEEVHDKATEPGGGADSGCHPPFVHVYGGTPLAARQIAEEAVDAFVHRTAALPAEYKTANAARLTTSTTRWLRLVDAEADRAGADDEAARLRNMIAATFPVHLTDIIARRAHVAYTSPAQAVEALPGVAQFLAEALGYTPAQMRGEILAATRLVEGVAVAQPKTG